MNCTRTRLRRRSLEALAVLACLLLCGCTSVEEINVKPAPSATLAVKEPWPLHVALVLDEGFTNYSYTWSVVGTDVLPLGPSLAQYARQVCEAAFRTVTVVPNVEAGAGKADCVLIPRVTGANLEVPTTAFSKPEMVIMVEWTMKDRGAQKPLWLTTIEGKTKEAAGNMWTYRKHRRIRNQKLFDDLARNTAAAFAGSLEIKRLAEPNR